MLNHLPKCQISILSKNMKYSTGFTVKTCNITSSKLVVIYKNFFFICIGNISKKKVN